MSLITVFMCNALSGSALTLCVQLLMDLPGNWGYYIMIAFFVLSCAGLCWCRYKCQQLCCTPGKKDEDDDQED
jgi:hypothetical protein